MYNRFLLGFLILVCFILTGFSYAGDFKEYFIKQNTFFYLYLNAEKVQNSKIYASANKYLIQENCHDYSKLFESAAKEKITEKDISEIYFSFALKNVKDTAAIKQDNVYYLSGFILKKDITIDKLLGILKESLKNEEPVSINKIKKSDNEIIQIKTYDGSIYIGVPSSKLVLAASELPELIILINSYKKGKSSSSSNNMSKLLLQIPSSSSLFAAIAIPSFMTKEFQQINNNFKQSEQNDVQYKINNAVKNLKGLTVETKTGDTLGFKINTFFSTEEGAKSFNELINQFMPLLKFQLFLMVQNSTLPVLNAITTGMADKKVSLSAVLTNDDFISISQMIKNKGKTAGLQ